MWDLCHRVKLISFEACLEKVPNSLKDAVKRTDICLLSVSSSSEVKHLMRKLSAGLCTRRDMVCLSPGNNRQALKQD